MGERWVLRWNAGRWTLLGLKVSRRVDGGTDVVVVRAETARSVHVDFKLSGRKGGLWRGVHPEPTFIKQSLLLWMAHRPAPARVSWPRARNDARMRSFGIVGNDTTVLYHSHELYRGRGIDKMPRRSVPGCDDKITN